LIRRKYAEREGFFSLELTFYSSAAWFFRSARFFGNGLVAFFFFFPVIAVLGS